MSSSFQGPTSNPARELAAIMFSDIAGYTAIMGRDEQKAIGALAAHRELLRSLLPKYNGRLIGEIGDGTLSSFHSALDAVNCAREMQAALEGDDELRVRIGIHVGDIVFSDNNVLGDGVNVASRIHALAPPGGICISEHVYDEIRNKPDIRARNLGQKTLKNVSHPIRVYSLVLDRAPTAAAVPGPNADRTWGGRRLIAVGVAMIAALAIVIVRSRTLRSLMPEVRSRVSHGPGAVTLAVLPFANVSGDKSDEYFSDGMTDEIRGDLSKIAGLQVTARTSSFAFKGRNEDVKKIARLLKVRSVLDGSVRRTADKIRIEVELIDASTGFAVWSQRYDEKLADVFQIQSEVAESVAENLKVRLLADEKARIEIQPTQNLEAYNLYLLGNYYLEQWTPGGFAKAAKTFSRAIEKDPRFARAYAGLAYAYEDAVDLTMPQRESGPKARAAAERALEIDDSLGFAHGAMGIALLNDWDWVGAEPQFKRALMLDPGEAGTHEGYAEYLIAMGRYDEALSERQHVLKLNPVSPGAAAAVGGVYVYARQYERALEYYQMAIEMAPDFWGGYGGRGWALFCQGKTDAAVPYFEKAAALADFDLEKAALGEIYAISGRRTEALGILEQLKQHSAHGYVTPIAFVAIYTGLGDKDLAFQWLEKAYDDRSIFLLSLKSPRWDPLRSDPRFQAIYKKVGLPEQVTIRIANTK